MSEKKKIWSLVEATYTGKFLIEHEGGEDFRQIVEENASVYDLSSSGLTDVTVLCEISEDAVEENKKEVDAFFRFKDWNDDDDRVKHPVEVVQTLPKVEFDRKKADLPAHECAIDIWKDGEWIPCTWHPRSPGSLAPQGYIGTAQTSNRPIQIGFHAWEQNDDEFRRFRLHPQF